MSDLKSILGKKFAQSGMGKSITAALVCERFEAMMKEKYGEQLGREVRAQSFKKGTLTLTVSSTVISQEIKLNQEEFVEGINDKLGEKTVSNIRFIT